MKVAHVKTKWGDSRIVFWHCLNENIIQLKMVSFIIKWIGSFHCRPKAEIQLERYCFFLFLCFLLLPQNSKFEQREMFQKNEKIVEIVEIDQQRYWRIPKCYQHQMLTTSYPFIKSWEMEARRMQWVERVLLWPSHSSRATKTLQRWKRSSGPCHVP